MRAAFAVTPSFALALCAVLAVSACSSPQQPTREQVAATRKAAVDAKAQRKLDMYRKLLQMKSYELAVSIGEEITNQFPQSAAAGEVAKTLPGIKKAGAAAAEKLRLQNLWLYQVGPQSGGMQSTAAIPASEPAGSGIRLILRRHSAWGNSAYLYDKGGKGFVCTGQCDLKARFDGHPVAVKGYLPNGGEPAMFIKDDKAFIAHMRKAKKITLAITSKSAGSETLTFEVAGFDKDQWKPVPKKK